MSVSAQAVEGGPQLIPTANMSLDELAGSFAILTGRRVQHA
jgi:hypothetical protein